MLDPTSLAAIIKSLLAAFDSGREVFLRLTAKYRSKKLRRKDLLRLEEEERLLGESFSHHPRRIKDEYEAHAARHGSLFKAGDDTARTSLAHILLQLNTGLAKIIEAFLIRSSKDHHLAHRSLLHLSESSSSQTVRILGQYHERLGKSKSNQSLESSSSKRRSPSRSHSSTPSTDKKKAPARKQFVRSKSDSAIVKVEKALEEPSKAKSTQTRKRKPSTTSIHPTSPKSARTENLSSSETLNPLTEVYPRLASLNQSMTNIPRGSPKTRRSPRPISTFTLKSDSTKLGEIPEDSWVAGRTQGLRYDYDANNEPLQWWPPQPVALQKEKKGFGQKLKFWR